MTKLIMSTFFFLFTACTSVEVQQPLLLEQEGPTLLQLETSRVWEAEYRLLTQLQFKAEAKAQAKKAALSQIFEVVWRGYLEKGGYLKRETILSRWQRVEEEFWSVWGQAPLWQAKVAAAICTKETLCGVDVKFSEWEEYRFEAANTNSSVDCGITQINSGSTKISCNELQDIQTAFEEQKRIINIKVRGSSSKKVWKERIWRYNGAKSYGDLILQWAGLD